MVFGINSGKTTAKSSEARDLGNRGVGHGMRHHISVCHMPPPLVRVPVLTRTCEKTQAQDLRCAVSWGCHMEKNASLEWPKI